MSAPTSSDETPDPQVEATSVTPADDVRQAAASSPLAEGDEGVLLQQVMRFRNADGSETLYATLRAEFSPGQRGVTLYLGFCPPFPLVPIVEAEAIEGPAAMVKIAHAQNNGTQIDVELEQPSATAVEVIVEVAALPSSPPVD